jgi:hypothetical protein
MAFEHLERLALIVVVNGKIFGLHDAGAGDEVQRLFEKPELSA